MVSLAEDLRLALDRTRTIESAMEYSRRELAKHLHLKPSMSIKDWLEIREAIEAKSDLETHRCKKDL
jgi:predicted ATP-grasp superfamily ATP-dependent carboligase